jgi:hypothetical protein
VDQDLPAACQEQEEEVSWVCPQRLCILWGAGLPLEPLPKEDDLPLLMALVPVLQLGPLLQSPQQSTATSCCLFSITGGGGSTTEGPSTPGPSGTTQAVPPGVKDSDTTTPSASTRGAFSTTPGGSNTNESSNNDTAAAVGTPSSGGFLGAGIASANAAAIGTPTAATPSAGGSSGGGGLEVLSLAGCSNLSSDGLRAFLAAPLVKRSLLALDVSRCIRVTRVALALPPTVGFTGAMSGVMWWLRCMSLCMCTPDIEHLSW